MKYIEHEKLQKVKDKSQVIGQFLDYLSDSGIYLCKTHTHNKHCYDDDEELLCGYEDDDYIPNRTPINDLLAAYFEIDLVKLEEEKRHMLDSIREENKSSEDDK